MPSVRFEHAISACERPQTYALDRATTGIGTFVYMPTEKYRYVPKFAVLWIQDS